MDSTPAVRRITATQTLEAREDALRWQRAFNAANTPSSPGSTMAGNYKALRSGSSPCLSSSCIT